MSPSVAAWEKAQERELARLRAPGGDREHLVEMLEMSALLELSRLTAAHLDLASYTQSVLDVITQFFAVDACTVALWVPGLPLLRATFGDAPDDDVLTGAVAGGEPQEVDGRHYFPLLLDGRVVGALAVTWADGPLSGRGFFAQAAHQLSTTLGILVEAERLRRQAATANALHLASSITSVEDEELDKLTSSLATLPNASGAQLSLLPALSIVPITCTAGLVDDALPFTERELTVDDTRLTVRLTWSLDPLPADLAAVEDVFGALVSSLMRAEQQRRLMEEVETDPLTGVGNRRRASRALSAALSRASRFGESVAVLAFDLDHFKQANDTYGHAVGDSVLQAFAQLLGHTGRGYDTVARMGGEEFILVCPATDAAGAARIAERARAETPTACAPWLDGWRQTVSIGIAVFPEAGEQPDRLLRAADEALYEAKRAGRDRAVVSSACHEPAH